jgi:hypothetical protein
MHPEVESAFSAILLRRYCVTVYGGREAGGPMNFGYNSNVRVGETTYHVQTEDRGPAHPFMDTVVYVAGRVVYKRSTSYEKYVKGTVEKSLAQWLRERLAQQHRDVIAGLEDGTLPAQGKEKTGPATKSDSNDASLALDLRLRNPKSVFTAGKVILEIEVLERNSNQGISDADIQVCLEHENHRVPCAEGRSDADGLVTLQFPMPLNIGDGSSLVVRAADGLRHGELRFNLKSKPRDPAPVSR